MGSMLDLVGGSVDLALPKIDLEGCDLLRDAPEEVKKSCSLEFANNYNLTAHVKQELVKKVQDHKLDVDSLSVVIASMTVGIRNDQVRMKTKTFTISKRCFVISLSVWCMETHFLKEITELCFTRIFRTGYVAFAFLALIDDDMRIDRLLP